jgi:hypothetical protein
MAKFCLQYLWRCSGISLSCVVTASENGCAVTSRAGRPSRSPGGHMKISTRRGGACPRRWESRSCCRTRLRLIFPAGHPICPAKDVRPGCGPSYGRCELIRAPPCGRSMITKPVAAPAALAAGSQASLGSSPASTRHSAIRVPTRSRARSQDPLPVPGQQNGKEPFQEPTWADSGPQPATLGHRLGCSSA